MEMEQALQSPSAAQPDVVNDTDGKAHYTFASPPHLASMPGEAEVQHLKSFGALRLSLSSLQHKISSLATPEKVTPSTTIPFKEAFFVTSQAGPRVYAEPSVSVEHSGRLQTSRGTDKPSLSRPLASVPPTLDVTTSTAPQKRRSSALVQPKPSTSSVSSIADAALHALHTQAVRYLGSRLDIDSVYCGPNMSNRPTDAHNVAAHLVQHIRKTMDDSVAVHARVHSVETRSFASPVKHSIVTTTTAKQLATYTETMSAAFRHILSKRETLRMRESGVKAGKACYGAEEAARIIEFYATPRFERSAVVVEETTTATQVHAQLNEQAMLVLHVPASTIGWERVCAIVLAGLHSRVSIAISSASPLPDRVTPHRRNQSALDSCTTPTSPAIALQRVRIVDTETSDTNAAAPQYDEFVEIAEREYAALLPQFIAVSSDTVEAVMMAISRVKASEGAGVAAWNPYVIDITSRVEGDDKGTPTKAHWTQPNVPFAFSPTLRHLQPTYSSLKRVEESSSPSPTKHINRSPFGRTTPGSGTRKVITSSTVSKSTRRLSITQDYRNKYSFESFLLLGARNEMPEPEPKATDLALLLPDVLEGERYTVFTHSNLLALVDAVNEEFCTSHGGKASVGPSVPHTLEQILHAQSTRTSPASLRARDLSIVLTDQVSAPAERFLRLLVWACVAPLLSSSTVLLTEDTAPANPQHLLKLLHQHRGDRRVVIAGSSSSVQEFHSAVLGASAVIKHPSQYVIWDGARVSPSCLSADNHLSNVTGPPIQAPIPISFVWGSLSNCFMSHVLCLPARVSPEAGVDLLTALRTDADGSYVLLGSCTAGAKCGVLEETVFESGVPSGPLAVKARFMSSVYVKCSPDGLSVHSWPSATDESAGTGEEFVETGASAKLVEFDDWAALIAMP